MTGGLLLPLSTRDSDGERTLQIRADSSEAYLCNLTNWQPQYMTVVLNRLCVIFCSLCHHYSVLTSCYYPHVLFHPVAHPSECGLGGLNPSLTSLKNYFYLRARKNIIKLETSKDCQKRYETFNVKHR